MDLEKLWNFISEQWDYFTGLVASLILALFIVVPSLDLLLKDSDLNTIVENLWYIKSSSVLLVWILIFIYWKYARRYPRSSKYKVGILVAIQDDTKETKRIKKEVIEQLNDLLKETSSVDFIEVLSLRNFRAKKVKDQITATEASDKTGTQFVIYGRIVDFSDQFSFKLHFIVRHRPLELKGQQIVRQGFAESLVDKKWSFLQADTIGGIDITTKNIREVSLYVMGVAAHQSYDFDASLKLHNNLKNIFSQDGEKKSELSPVNRRLPMWISDSYLALALIAYYQENDLTKAISLNSEAIILQPTNNAAILNQAMYMLEDGNDPEAERLVKILRKRNTKRNLPDSAWRYSEAFLLFNNEKYERGLKSYKKAFDGFITDFTYKSLIKYIENRLTKHPDKIQFIFAIAHIMINNFGNYPRALPFLEKFFKDPRHSEDKYRDLIPLAKQHINDAYKSIKISKKDQVSFEDER